MTRQVQLITIRRYHDEWYTKSPAVQVSKCFWSAALEIVECEKIEFKEQYRIRLSDGSYRILDGFMEVFLETQ